MSITRSFVAARPALLLLMELASCSSGSMVGDPTRATGGGGAVTLNLPAGTGGKVGWRQDGGSRSTPSSSSNCGNSASGMTQLPADLLLVLDRSGSMTNSISDDDPCDPASGTCAQRWTTMLAAMRTVLATSSTSIRWGLKFFSTPGLTSGSGLTPVGCVVTTDVEVPVGMDNADAITANIATTSPNYNTPTRAVIEVAIAYLKTVQDGRSKYILLATDGQPNCPAAGDVATATDLDPAMAAIAAARSAGFPVYVIGVGPSAGNLDQMASRGGTSRFYPALTPQALTAALNAIIGTVASCVYTMSSTPPDQTNLGVYLDKQLVLQSATDGWMLSSPNAVTFHGPTCERIKAGAYQSVQILFGCPDKSELPAVIP
ncbi:MAG TPA: vWA domain-containing protein [Polyangia bacterium]